MTTSQQRAANLDPTKAASLRKLQRAKRVESNKRPDNCAESLEEKWFDKIPNRDTTFHPTKGWRSYRSGKI